MRIHSMNRCHMCQICVSDTYDTCQSDMCHMCHHPIRVTHMTHVTPIPCKVNGNLHSRALHALTCVSYSRVAMVLMVSLIGVSICVTDTYDTCHFEKVS